MSTPFTGLSPAGNPVGGPSNWGVTQVASTPSPFVPFPNLGQPAVDEVGYGQGGYGEGGYDAQSVPASTASPTTWTVYTLK